MFSLLQPVTRFVVRYLLSCVVVVALLLAGKWVMTQRADLGRIRAELPALTLVQTDLRAYRDGLSRQVKDRAALLQNATLNELDARIDRLGQEITGGSRQYPPLVTAPFLPGGEQLSKRLAAHFRSALEVALLKQELDYLKRLRPYIEAAAGRKAAESTLEQRRLVHVNAYAALQADLRARDAVRQAHPVLVWIPGTAPFMELKKLEADEIELRMTNERAHRDYLAQKAFVEKLPTLQPPRPLEINQGTLDEILGQFDAQAKELRDFLDQNWLTQAARPIEEVARPAALIVLAAFLTPLLIRLLLYFALAPLAMRRPAIFIDPAASGSLDVRHDFQQAGMAASPGSAVSKKVSIGQDEELLIHRDYLQSQPTGGKMDTKWLLDWSCPLTSMAAGLRALTRVRVEQPQLVTISSTKDPLAEVAVLRLPTGAALVLHPRCLVGVLHRRDAPLAITRHWRLGSLHAWLTMQLRYLVFRGPVTLIVKGCRGVRVEPAGSGRSVSQWATLGFSAQAAYSTTRAEPFAAYLFGSQALFHDRFEGRNCYYVYEETPPEATRRTTVEKWIEGALDAALKPFGI